MKRILVFGVFDGLHPGHDAMLKEARALGDELVVAVAQDTVVRSLKNKAPKRKLFERLEALRGHEAVTEVVEGDSEIGTWKILERVRPDIVACGYDQKRMYDDLVSHIKTYKLRIEARVLSPHKPNEFHSSLLES